MGSPNEVAARYTDKGRYLIGPALYPIYKMIAAIVLGAVLLGMTISTVIGLLQVWGDTGAVWRQLGMLVPNFLTGGAAAIGFLTMAFALMERFMPEKQIKSLKDEDAWDPSQLPPVPEKYNVMKPWEEVLGIVLTVAAIVIFNAFPHVTGICCVDGQSCTPILSQEALEHFLPFWNVLWVLSIGKSGLLLARGRWEMWIHIYDIVLSFLNIAVLAIMIAGPRLLSDAAVKAINNATQVPIGAYIQYGLMLAFAVAIIMTAVETVIKIYHLIRDRAQAV